MLPQDLIQPPVGPVGACLAVVLQSRGPRALLELLCEVRLHGAGGAVAARSWPPLALKVAEVAGDWCHLQGCPAQVPEGQQDPGVRCNPRTGQGRSAKGTVARWPDVTF